MQYKHAPTQEAEEDDLNEFYDHLPEAHKQCKSQETVILIGEFNAIAGQGHFEILGGTQWTW